MTKTKAHVLAFRLCEDRSDQYYHLYAEPELITPGDPDPDKRGSLQYGAEGYPYLDSMVITCQGNARDRATGVYGWEVVFKPYSVSAYESGRMFKTFALIERKEKALVARFGPAKSYGQYVARIAECVGAVQMFRKSLRFPGSWQVFTIGEAVSIIDHMVEVWQAEESAAQVG